MTDATLDTLLEAVRELAELTGGLADRMNAEQALAINYNQIVKHAGIIADDIKALIAQRKGRPDDEPSK